MATHNLTGQIVRYQPKFSLLGVLFLVVAALLLAGNIFTHNQHLLMLSLPAGVLGWCLFYFCEKAFEATLNSEAMEVADPPERIPYDSIASLSLAGRQPALSSPTMKPGPIVVVHNDGVLRIPQPNNVPAEEVYRHLLTVRGETRARELNDKLHDYFQQQLTEFGPDRVWSFTARFILKQGAFKKTPLYYAGAFMLIGITWIIASMLLDFGHHHEADSIWMWAGIVTASISGFAFIFLAISNRESIGNVPNWKASSIVISPKGIAMIQGAMKGHLRWDELRDIRQGTKNQRSAPKKNVPLHLVVDGATIPIIDIYNQPLSHISEVLQGLWKPTPEILDEHK